MSTQEIYEQIIKPHLENLDQLFAKFHEWIEIDEESKKLDWAARLPSSRKRWVLEGEAKELFRTIIKDWLKEHDAEDVNVSLMFRFSLYFNEYRIHIERISIYSSKGSIGEKPRWLNKISVLRDKNIHVARTDERFIGQFVSDFIKFATTLRDFVEISRQSSNGRAAGF